MLSLPENRFKDKVRVDTNFGFFKDFVSKCIQAFDTICYVNVLGHVEDDNQSLKKAHASLFPGGNLLLFVPALQSLYNQHDETVGHFRRYSRQGLIRQVTSCGFNIVSVKNFDNLGIIPWYIAFVLLKRRVTGSQVSFLRQVFSPGSKTPGAKLSSYYW